MLTILNMSDNHIQTAEKTLRTFIINAEKEALSELLPADAWVVALNNSLKMRQEKIALLLEAKSIISQEVRNTSLKLGNLTGNTTLQLREAIEGPIAMVQTTFDSYVTLLREFEEALVAYNRAWVTA